MGGRPAAEHYNTNVRKQGISVETKMEKNDFGNGIFLLSQAMLLVLGNLFSRSRNV